MSKIKVNRIENTSTTDGGVSIDTDGHVTIDGQQLPTAGPLSNRNLIINGAMQVAQRGTSSTTSGYGSVDRYFVQYTGGTVTQSQTAITSGSPYDEGFRSILRITNTSASSAAGSIRNSFQYIEAQNLANSGWNYASSSSYVTLSFWVRSSVEQEFYGYLRAFDGTEQGYSFSLGTLSANTWVKVTKVIPGNSNITVDNDNGTGLQVNIAPFWGTDFTDAGNTLNTWGAFASGNRTPNYTNTWASTAGATFDITGVQLEVGSKATPFEHESYGQTLIKCMRYYQKYTSSTSGYGISGAGYCETSTQTEFVFFLTAPMRTLASASITEIGDLEVKVGPSNFDVTGIVGVSFNDVFSLATIRTTNANSGASAGTVARLRANGAGAGFQFNAEL
jgi:hypothetical protein